MQKGKLLCVYYQGIGKHKLHLLSLQNLGLKMSIVEMVSLSKER